MELLKRTWVLAAASAFVLAPAAPSADCNGNGTEDGQDIAAGTSRDCNANDTPDECEIGSGKILFEVPRETGIGRDVCTPLYADVDGDGDIDVVGAYDTARVVKNQGGGEFGAPEIYSLSLRSCWRLRAGDLDGDGSTDLVAVSTDTPVVHVLQNQGDGTFAVREQELLPFGARSPRLADFDSDGYPDLLASGTQPVEGGYRILDEIYLCRNRGDATFAEARVLTLAPLEHAGGIVAADWNGDGALDLAVPACCRREKSETFLAVLLNTGDGAFHEPSLYSPGEGDLRLEGVADFDADGLPDLLWVNRTSEDVLVLRNRGDGSFDHLSPLPPGNYRSAYAADVDGDGDADIVASDSTDPASPTAVTAVFLNAGGASFVPLPGPAGVLTGDLNGDGLPEMLRPAAGRMLSVLENLGQGRFRESGAFYTGFLDRFDGEALDMDGDGDLDLVGGASYLENVTTAQAFSRGCDPFLRGDVNADGVVSISDMIMLRRFLFGAEGVPPCLDAADVTDDESVDISDAVWIVKALFMKADWPLILPEPFPAPDRDPTPVPDPGNPFNERRTLDMDARLPCSEYRVEPPEATEDVIRLGNVYASPGAEVLVPVYISNSVPVEAVQLVLKYEPEMLEILPDSLSHERTFYEEAFPADPERLPVPEVSVLTIHPEAGVATAAIAGSLVFADRQIPPGSNTLIAWIRVKVSAEAAEGTVLTVNPTNGQDGLGVGPYRLRNEISYQGRARFVSTIPRLEGAIVSIVGDQSFFRGDANGDEQVDISDALYILDALFAGGPRIACADAADANDDGVIDISDPIAILSFLFLGETTLPPPHPYKGFDPTSDDLRCQPGSSEF